MDRPPGVMDALEHWRVAKDELDAATPWTADWLRLRMVEQDRRFVYERLNNGHAPNVYRVTADADGRQWIARVHDVPELLTRADRLDHALQMIGELIATVNDLDPHSFEIEVEVAGRTADAKSRSS